MKRKTIVLTFILIFGILSSGILLYSITRRQPDPVIVPDMPFNESEYRHIGLDLLIPAPEYVAIGDKIAIFQKIYPFSFYDIFIPQISRKYESEELQKKWEETVGSLEEQRERWEKEKTRQEDILAQYKLYAETGTVFQKNASILTTYDYFPDTLSVVYKIDSCTWYIPYGNKGFPSRPFYLIQEYKGEYSLWKYQTYANEIPYFPEELVKKAFPNASFTEEE